MSDALILDSDMQLIIKELTKLKALRIRACLEHLTDCALTGLSSGKLDAYECIVASQGFKPDRTEVLPLSVSNLEGFTKKQTLLLYAQSI